MNYAGFTECLVAESICIRSLFTFSKRTFTAGYSFQGESHDFYEAVFVLDGKAGITAGKEALTLSAGQMILHVPKEFHAIWSDYGSSPEILIFSFRAEKFPTMTDRIFALSPEQIEEVKSAFRAAERAFVLDGVNVKEARSEAQAEIVVKRLEIFLLSVLESGKGTGGKIRSRSGENYFHIVSVMENHLGERLSAEELAKKCGMSVPSLEKSVSKYAGCGAMSYYNELKMKKATELLKSGMSVKEVARSLDFTDQNYFSLRYKKWSGSSPSAIGKFS